MAGVGGVGGSVLLLSCVTPVSLAVVVWSTVLGWGWDGGLGRDITVAEEC